MHISKRKVGRERERKGEEKKTTEKY